MSKVICDVCGTTYPETAEQCPICGCAKVLGGRQAADGAIIREEQQETPRGFFKKGKFASAKNKPKAAESYEKEDDNDESEESESKGKTVLIVFLLVVLVAVLTVTGYLMLRYYLPNVLEFGEETTLASVPEITVDTTEARIPCESLTLTNSTVELEKMGQAWLLNVVVLPEDTTDELFYASSDTSVATVTEHGRVNAVGSGEAIITVSCGDRKLECLIRCTFVVETTAPADGNDETQENANQTLTLNREDITFFGKGESFRFSAGPISLSQITWTSDDPKIATIENGSVTAVSPGVTTIHAEYQGEKASCIIRCKFEVDPDAEEGAGVPGAVYTISKTEATVKVGRTFQLTLKDADGNLVDVTWYITDGTVCSVAGNTVTGKAAGVTTVSASYEGKTYACVVTVTE